MFDRWLSFFTSDMAIDLGTANTLVFMKGRGIVLNEPSVVAVEKATNRVIAVGRKAKGMLGRTPDEIFAIRPLQNGVISDFEKAEDMLREFIGMVDRKKFLVRPRIIVSVPSGLTEVERRAVRDSALSAGAREVALVQEPVAAAIGVGLPVEQPTGNMVIDIGGGTTEIAVIALNGIVTNNSVRVGGDKMDLAIVQYVKRAYNILIGDQTAEQIKIRIGSAFPLDPEPEMEVRGRDLVSGIPKSRTITSAEVRTEALQEPLDQIVEAVRQSLDMTPPELAADIVDRGILMTGGGSLLKGIDRKLHEAIGLPIRVAEDALICVVLGAGKILEHPEQFDSVLN
jgi:rod shape-determining protein MreB